MNELVKIDFYGDTVYATQEGNEMPLVAVKTMVEKCGIDWSSQLKRIKRDPVLSEGMVVMTIPSLGGMQETVALPLNFIAGFLFGIDSSRIIDLEARQKVITYQRECHDVLYRHFFGVRADGADPTANWDWDIIREKIQMVREVRLSAGKKAAVAMWQSLGLPVADEKVKNVKNPSQGIDFVQNFLSEMTEPYDDGRLSATILYEEYCAWAKQTKNPSMTQTAFGLTLRALEIPKTKNVRCIFYLGLRIKHKSELEGQH